MRHNPRHVSGAIRQPWTPERKPDGTFPTPEERKAETDRWFEARLQKLKEK